MVWLEDSVAEDWRKASSVGGADTGTGGFSNKPRAALRGGGSLRLGLAVL